MIGVIDYRAGNAPSVIFALRRLDIPARLVSTPDEVAASSRLVLPGVGAARATLDSLRESQLLAPLEDRVRREGVPFLGICVGLQILFEHSEEGDVDCLGWIPGTVRRFPPGERIPQIGWNEVRFRREHPVTAALPARPHCYFVNSYFAAPTDDDTVLGVTSYGTEFCSVAATGSIIATQFHAEKSGELGLRLLAAFATWEPS